MELPKDFFTLSSMFTFTGAAGGTFVVTNGLQQAFGWRPKWLGLAIAQLIVNVGVYSSGGVSVVDYFVGVVNGFLVYLTAGGATGAASKALEPDLKLHSVAPPEAPPETKRRSFLTPWFD
jgi:hypothetical protein